MNRILIFIGFIALLTSCTFYEPEFRGGESISNVNIEGRKITLDAGATIYNPNNFAIKVKPSALNVYLDDRLMGEVHLDMKVKMKKKSETAIKAPLTLTVKNGVMFSLMSAVAKGKVNVRMKGKVKAGVWFLSKAIDVNEYRVIDGSTLGI
jgi:LEA14-like dessication related protein